VVTYIYPILSVSAKSTDFLVNCNLMKLFRTRNECDDVLLQQDNKLAFFSVKTLRDRDWRK
jgi:hypothetical protein